METFFEQKIFFNKNSLCFAFVAIQAIWFEKLSLLLKFTPRSSTSETRVKFLPANSGKSAAKNEFGGLFEIIKYLDFSEEIGNCHLSDHFVIFASVDFNFFPKGSLLLEL